MIDRSDRTDAAARVGDAERAGDEERYRQVLALAQRGAVPSLIAFLGDPSWRVRRAAMRALGDLSDAPTLVPALIAGMAASDNAGLRNSCAEGLLRVGTAAVPELVDGEWLEVRVGKRNRAVVRVARG